MSLAKRKKQKTKTPSAGEALDSLQTRGDALSDWISQNPAPILAVGGAVLVAAAIYALATSSVDGNTLEASTAIAQTKNAYRAAMGGSYAGGPAAVPEPANPETAQSLRNEYIERFQALAEENAGSEMASLALVQVSNLRAQLDDIDGALESIRTALEPYGEQDTMRGILLERIALLHERKGDLAAAAEAHLEASAITRYPLRYFALLNAARTQAEADQPDLAIANFDRVTSEAPDLLIPEHTQALLLELKATQSR